MLRGRHLALELAGRYIRHTFFLETEGRATIVALPSVFPPKAALPGRPGLLLVLNVHVLGVDDFAFLLLPAGPRAISLRRWLTRSTRCRRWRRVGFVHRLGQLVACLGQLLVRRLHLLRRRRTFQRLLRFS